MVRLTGLEPVLCEEHAPQEAFRPLSLFSSAAINSCITVCDFNGAFNSNARVGADFISALEPNAGVNFRAEIDSAPATGANLFDVEYNFLASLLAEGCVTAVTEGVGAPLFLRCFAIY